MKRRAPASSSDPSHDIFICHASEDKPFVRRLARALRAHGVRAWVDEYEMRPGDSIHGKIGDAILQSGYMLVLLSRRSKNKAWVKREISAGLAEELKRRKVFVLPALIDIRPDGLSPLLADKLAVDFRSGFQNGVSHILARLGHSSWRQRRDKPTESDVQSAYLRLPSRLRFFLLGESLSVARHSPASNPTFTTMFLSPDERGLLQSLAIRGLVRTKLIEKGMYWDESDGETPGRVYKGNLTALGVRVVEVADEADRRRWLGAGSQRTQ